MPSKIPSFMRVPSTVTMSLRVWACNNIAASLRCTCSALDLNTNVKFPLYQCLTKARFKGGFLQSRDVMGVCKNDSYIPTRQGGLLMAASFGHERRIRKSGCDQDGMGSFSYLIIEATGVLFFPYILGTTLCHEGWLLCCYLILLLLCLSVASK